MRYQFRRHPETRSFDREHVGQALLDEMLKHWVEKDLAAAAGYLAAVGQLADCGLKGMADAIHAAGPS